MKNLKRISLTLMILAKLCLYQSNAQSLELSKQQMLEDFDQQVAYINAVAVHKRLNEVRLGIDYNEEFSRLRNGINKDTTPCQFLKILNQVNNLVQDQHCNFMSYNYLSQYAQYQVKFNFEDKEGLYDMVKAYEELCPKRDIALKLPLIYSQGQYLVYADFIYKGHHVARGTEVVQYQSAEILPFIKHNYSAVYPIRWDSESKTPYHTSFYQFGEEDFTLTLKSKEEEQTIGFNLSDTIVYDKEPVRQMYYYSQKEEQVQFFEEQKILYVALPFMDTDISDNLNNKIDSIVAVNPDFEKVVVDIRGNPGGSDLAWRGLIQHIVEKPLGFNLDIKFKYSPETLQKYNKGKSAHAESIELLNDAEFWSEKKKRISFKKDRKSLKFEGKIYVLVDEYIYSSAGNFANVCLKEDQLISVGYKTDLVGGIQKEPLFMKLNHSGLVMRAEPVLDFSGVKSIDDFSHNRVEVQMDKTVENEYLKTTYTGDIYGKDFLLNHDPLLKYVIKH